MKIQTLGLSPPEKRGTPFDNPAVPLSEVGNWMVLGGGHDTDAGEFINDAMALRISTVFSIIRILADAVSSLPINLYTLTPQGKIRELVNPLAHLLAVSPNPEMSSVSWVDVTMVHLALTGNSYSEIQRDGADNPIGLWPLNPRITCPVRLPNGELAYKTSDGEAAGQSRIIASENMIHVLMSSMDGIVGMSPIMHAKQTLGMAVASERFGNRFFANYAMPQIALMVKKLIKPEDKLKMRKDWESLQSGSNQHRVAILDQEMDIKTLSVSPQEAQFLEQRRYTRADIAALWKIPLHYLGDNTKLANSSVEGQNLSFVVDTLKAYTVRIEAEITRKLLNRVPGREGVLTVSFDYSERLRGDTAAQAAWATAGRNGGWLSANDVRRAQGLNEGGPELDQYITPVNYINAKQLLIPPPSTAAETVAVNE